MCKTCTYCKNGKIYKTAVMKKSGRYKTSGMIEDQYEPGSRGRVLKNLSGITTKKEIEAVETREYLRVTDQLLQHFDRKHCFTAEDVCFMHHAWLESIYKWAGHYRQVFISKGDFSFSAPSFIPRLMDAFEKDILSRYTPCTFSERGAVITALAIVHTELLLIHPFRDGNGRLARLLAVLMGFQAGLPFLDFSILRGSKRQSYFVAVAAGLDRNYAPMINIFSDVVYRSER
jgi:cell filamentation protein